MPREVQDSNGVRWTCAQAYAGLSNGAPDDSAAEVEEGSGCFRVICTPSGGSQSVELELPGGWEDSLGDDDLLIAIRTEQA